MKRIFLSLLLLPISFLLAQPYFENSYNPRLISDYYGIIDRIFLIKGENRVELASYPPRTVEWNKLINELRDKIDYRESFPHRQVFELFPRKYRQKSLWTRFELTFTGSEAWQDNSDWYQTYPALRGYSVLSIRKGIFFEGQGILFGKFRDFETINRLTYYDDEWDTKFFRYPHKENLATIGDVSEFDFVLERGFLFINLNWGNLKIGRDKLRWGPAKNGTLLFSGFTPALDFIYNLEIPFSFFKFQTFLARIPDTTELRRISAQRIELQMTKRLVVGISQVVLHSRTDPFHYFNPLSFYYALQREDNTNDDNLLASFEISYIPIPRLKLYLEFMNDDFIVTPDITKTPSKFGVMTGLQFGSEKSSMTAEYTFIPRWTYTHVSDINAHTFLGFPFGYWGGSDLEDYYLSLTQFISPLSGIRFSINLLYHGEGNLTEKWEGSGFPYDTKSPTGVLERRINFGITGFLINSRGFQGEIGINMTKIRNYMNIRGDTRTRWRIKLWLGFPLVDRLVPI